MSQVTGVRPADQMQTREGLASDLRALGLRAGQTVLVHASMRRIGWIPGGAAAVVAAIRDVLGTEGTVVVPTQTAGNSDTSRAHLASTKEMTAAQLSRYRAAMPAFDPESTPSTGMGLVAEQVRTTPGAFRSAHPQTSFAAIGPMAVKLMAGHRHDCHLGESSPLARLYDIDARILLLGVGYAMCTAFHLAEYRYLADPPRRRYRCVVASDGQPRWLEYLDVVLDDRDFGALGADFDSTAAAARGRVGDADCRLTELVAAVDFAVAWLRAHRPAADGVTHCSPSSARSRDCPRP